MKVTTIDKVRQYVRDKSDTPSGDRTPPSITISRMTGAGGTSVAHELADYLQTNLAARGSWTVFDKNLIQKVLDDHHLPQKLAEDLEEKKASPYLAYFNEMVAGHPPLTTLVHKTSETIFNLARRGHAIIIGRGANIVTEKLDNVVRVRLVGSLDLLAHRMAERDDLSLDKAKAFCRENDKNRAGYLKQHFDKDINDPLLYDLIINTDKLSDTQVVQIIGEVALRRYAG